MPRCPAHECLHRHTNHISGIVRPWQVVQSGSTVKCPRKMHRNLGRIHKIITDPLASPPAVLQKRGRAFALGRMRLQTFLYRSYSAPQPNLINPLCNLWPQIYTEPSLNSHKVMPCPCPRCCNGYLSTNLSVQEQPHFHP